MSLKNKILSFTQLGRTFNRMIAELKETTVSRNYLNSVINSMVDTVVVIDREFKITDINKSTGELLGYGREELIGKHFNVLCSDHEICERNLKLLIAEGAVSNIDTFYRAREGGEIPVVLSASTIRSRNNNANMLVIVAKDNTTYVKANEKMQEERDKQIHSENRLKQKQQELIAKHEELNNLFKKVAIANRERQKIMDSVGDMIILTDHEGVIKRVNKAVKEFTGKSDKDILDTNWEELIYEHELEATTLYAGSTELFHRPTHKWYELSSYPFEDVDLDFSGNVITIHETTEIKKITEELEKSGSKINENRIKLQSAHNQISVLMQNVTNQNDTSIRLSNLNLKKCYELKNCTNKDCFCYGKGPLRCWQIAGTYCGGKIQGTFAQKYYNCSECNVFQQATSDPISQIGEQFNNMMHVIEIKNRELENAYAELKNTQAQILQREKMASIGQLAAGVAHEINNPTGFILSNLGSLGKYVNRLIEFINTQAGALELLKEAEVSEEVAELRKKLKLDYILEDIDGLINESIDGAERIKKIVQNLKSFSRLDEAEYKPADINECIESTLNIVWNELKYNSTVIKDYGKLPLTRCYPQQLNQVFMNLLINAAHAIEKQGEIKIKTWNGDGTVNISISDTGSGIAEDRLNKIFEPFFTTKPAGKGTGLGLSITYDIVKKHNGDIKVESEVNKGTTFTVKIPVVEAVRA